MRVVMARGLAALLALDVHSEHATPLTVIASACAICNDAVGDGSVGTGTAAVELPPAEPELPPGCGLGCGIGCETGSEVGSEMGCDLRCGAQCGLG